MIHNIIPINYGGGLGGQFLASFLFDARNNNQTDWIFSKDGNAHSTNKDWGSPPHGLGRDPTGILNINYLMEYSKTIPEDSRVFVHGHFADPDLLMQYVDKQIKIYFEPEQLNEVVGMFMLKNPDTTVIFDDPINAQHYNNHLLVNWRRYILTKLVRLSNNCPDLEPRMLNISWNEMIRLDPDILISKLSNFTQIPAGNFNKDKFNEWRILTHKTLDRLKQAGLT